MKNFFKILKFEYLNCVRNKAFIIITAFLVCGSFLFSLLPGLIISITQESSDEIQENTEKSIIAVMKCNYDDELVKSEIAPYFPDYDIKITDEDRKTVENKVNNDEYIFAAEIDSPLSLIYITKNNTIYDTNSQLLSQAVKNMYTVTKLSEHGLSQAETDALMNTPVNTQLVSTGTDQTKNYFPVYLLMCILFTAITTYGQLVTQSVVSEKNTRAMELLITCAKPAELMFGKVIGAGLAGLTQLALIFMSVSLSFTYSPKNMIPEEIREFINFPVETLISALIFFILGYFIYAFLLGALASFASKTEDLNGLTTPVLFILIGIYMMLIFMCSGGMVDSTVMIVLSYFPLSAPMAMFVRSTLVDITIWEVAVSVVLQLATIVVFGMLASAIYKIGVLMYGNPPKISEIINMVKKSKNS